MNSGLVYFIDVQVAAIEILSSSDLGSSESRIEDYLIPMTQVIQGLPKLVDGRSRPGQDEVRLVVGLLRRVHFYEHDHRRFVEPVHGLPFVLHPHDEALPIEDRLLLHIGCTAGGYGANWALGLVLFPSQAGPYHWVGHGTFGH